MKASSGCKPFRGLVRLAVLLSTVLTAGLVPVCGQQDVDPSWYDPWAATNPAHVHSPTAQTSVHLHPGKVGAGPLQFSRKTRGTAHDAVNIALRAAQTRPKIRPLTRQAKKEH